MKRDAVRDELTTFVKKTREELFRLKREHAHLLDAADSAGASSAEGSAALRKAGLVGVEMLRALAVYEEALTRLSIFARESRGWGVALRTAGGER